MCVCVCVREREREREREMIRFEGLKDHSEHSVKSRLEMRRNVREGPGSDLLQETWGEMLVVLTRVKWGAWREAGPPKREGGR